MKKVMVWFALLVFVAAFENTSYFDYIKNSTTYLDVMKSLYKYEKDYAKKLLTDQPLSISTFISYDIQKKLELINISVLLKLAKFDPKLIGGALI